MNGAPLAPQHGFPLRLVVPGWYGMASVKWLTRIEVLARPFDGQQQAAGYHYRQHQDDPGVPVTHQKVKSLMVPPGIPDWYTRRRLVERGSTQLTGRAWSGGGVYVARVEVAINGLWRDAGVESPPSRGVWQGWRCEWRAEPGEYELACRATDAAGATQPDDPAWNASGMGNNAIQRVAVTVQVSGAGGQLRGADVLAQALARAGVRHLFSLSGNQIMPVYDAAPEAGLSIVHVRHEGAAVHMADAWGRFDR